MNKFGLTVRLGEGRVSVASGVVGGVPSIVLEPLANSYPIGTEVSENATRTDFPIILQFTSIEALGVWRRQLDRIENMIKEADNDT